MTTYTAVLDNSKTNVEGHSKFLNRLFGAGVPTSFLSTSLKVVQRGAGANMSVDVSVGDAHLELPSTNYSFWSWIDAVSNVTITAADATNPRIDAIVAWVDTAVTTIASNNSPGSFKFSAIAGTPAGSPTAPLDATIQTALGASVAWTRLSNVTVGAGVSSIVTANIADTRTAIASRLTIGSAAISSASMFSTALNPETRTSESLSDYVASGCVVTTTSGLGWSMSSGVVYIGGKRVPVNSATGNVVASKDTYFAVDNTGTLTYTGSLSVANNASSPTLPANSIWIAIPISNGSAITSVNTGQIGAVGPTVSGCILMVSDTNGQRIYPTARQTLIGYAQITSNFATAGSNAAVTGLSTSVIVPASARRIKVSVMVYKAGNSGSPSNLTLSLWDGTVGSGTQLGSQQFTVGGSNYGSGLHLAIPTSPSGTKTYNVGLSCVGGTLSTIEAAATSPAVLMVELA